jgi:cytochrome o ubiquinol oxidase subunit IV
MARQHSVVRSNYNVEHVTLRSYLFGFTLSVFLTLTAFSVAEEHVHSGHTVFTHPIVIILTAVLAIAQFFVQIYYFLHLGKESKPRWKLLILCFMVLVVLILVIGSIWIMYNLNYRMTPDQMNQYMINQNGGI